MNSDEHAQRPAPEAVLVRGNVEGPYLVLTAAYKNSNIHWLTWWERWLLWTNQTTPAKLNSLLLSRAKK